MFPNTDLVYTKIMRDRFFLYILSIQPVLIYIKIFSLGVVLNFFEKLSLKLFLNSSCLLSNFSLTVLYKIV